MNNLKKLLSLVLVLVLSLSLTNGFVAKASTTGITITLRVANEKENLVYPTQVTLDEKDLANDFGLDLSIDTAQNDNAEDDDYSMLRALAKYFSEYKNVKNEDMSKYIDYDGFYLKDIKLDGENTYLTESDAASYWKTVNNGKACSTGISTTILKNGDAVEILEQHNNFSDKTMVGYGSFDKKEVEVTEGDSVSLKLTNTYATYDENGNEKENVIGVEEANINVYSLADGKVSEDKTITSTSKGNVYTFKASKAGTYYVTAYKEGSFEDKKYGEITLAIAKIVINEKKEEAQEGTQKKDQKVTNTGSTAKATKTTKLAAPKSLKAKVKKKKITLSWKKVKKAKGYRIYISKKNKKNFKKYKDVKKTKIVIKKKKGKYFLKVAAYTKSGKKKVIGKKSKVVKAIVK